MYPVARDNSSFFSNHFEKEMKKATPTARDVLEQHFDDDSDFSGREEGEEVYAYCDPTFSASTLKQDLELGRDRLIVSASDKGASYSPFSR